MVTITDVGLAGLLAQKNPSAWLLLTQIACRPGTMFTASNAGMSRSQFRCALRVLDVKEYAIMTTTHEGTICHLGESAPLAYQVFRKFSTAIQQPHDDHRALSQEVACQRVVIGSHGWEPSNSHQTATKTPDLLRNLYPTAIGDVSEGIENEGVASVGEGGTATPPDLVSPPSHSPPPSQTSLTPSTREIRRERGESLREGVLAGRCAEEWMESLAKGDPEKYGRLDREDLLGVYARWCRYRRKRRPTITMEGVRRDAGKMLRVLDAGGDVELIAAWMDRAMDEDHRWTGWFFEDAFEREVAKKNAPSADCWMVSGGGSDHGVDDMYEMLRNGVSAEV